MTMNTLHSQQKVTPLNFVSGDIMPSEKASITLTPNQVDTSFNFDLDKMRKSVEGKSHIVPNTLNNFDEFDAWLNQL